MSPSGGPTPYWRVGGYAPYVASRRLRSIWALYIVNTTLTSRRLRSICVQWLPFFLCEASAAGLAIALGLIDTSCLGGRTLASTIRAGLDPLGAFATIGALVALALAELGALLLDWAALPLAAPVPATLEAPGAGALPLALEDPGVELAGGLKAVGLFSASMH